MRCEQEMMDLIINRAKEDERVRAVYMNGSRTNQKVPKDIFQDYDIVYVVKETYSFINDEDWIHGFGDILIFQEPDRNSRENGLETNFEESYGYLMLFKDGNRIDLHIETKEHMRGHYLNDKLTVPLLDKDNCLPSIPEPTDSDYHVKKPSESMYLSCCNNFWWCQQNIAKSLWRDELPYAKFMMESVVRQDLNRMVEWWIGTTTNFGVSTGKVGNLLKKQLPESHWNKYSATYSDDNYENIWDSLFISGELFRELGKDIANHLSFSYPSHEDEEMTEYLKQVRGLSSDAKEVVK
ncbi:aminoglycoside 6-adenylyltransferase [Guptibacillus algicola]|uniref:aminoglycoside 6-adenylyltransferase n=1 Tax=Guptibacillus algicola TaxID=225844 RepID=UPI001CD7E6D5|nr:aminoglycoside 6-adenylyltransferase [Alkalihalobacillus algicola]MCA0985687.1 aminoglycoside 6-adenylyltransferase [Alkalihalobacillus algicola]